MNAEIQDRVRKVLAEARELLNKDGGTVELVGIDPEGVVTIRLSGTCATCRPGELPTLRAGIERWLRAEVPEVRRVEAV